MMKIYADDELRRSAACGDAKAVRKLLLAGADASDRDNAAMRRALRHGHAKIVNLLLKAGADFSENTEEFLQLAAKHRNARSLKMLLRVVKTTISPGTLNQVLYTTIKERNTQAVDVLIAAGANPEADENRSARLAATVGSVPILQILHRKGADFDAREGEILSNAVNGGHLDATRYILACGVQVNARAHMAITAALVLGDSEMLETLLDAGGTLQHPYLITDVAARDSVESLLLLIRRGCEFHSYAADIAMNSVRHNALRVLQYVHHNATIPQRARDLELQIAADKTSEKIVDFLLERGADPSADKSDALQRAVKTQRITIAGKLIKAGGRVPHLDASALTITAKAANWAFLIHLLHHSLTVAPVILSTFEAVAFFHQVPPQAFLEDACGKLHPRYIRKERHSFAKANGRVASKKSADEAIFVSLWLADFLIIQRGHD